MNMEPAIPSGELRAEAVARESDVAQWIFDGLKPLRAACASPEFDFLAYLLEMTETEAHRLMIAKRRQSTNP